MKNSNRINAALICICALIYFLNVGNSFSQSTTDNNTPSGGSYLGWSGAQNLEVKTNNLTHMQMMQTGNSTVNGYTIARGGFVGLSQDPILFTSGVGSPFSLLHLNGDNNGVALTNGYRRWMSYGLTYTHNRDLMYVGQRAMGAYDATDAVIAWADNTGEFNGPDNLCFVFSTGDGTSSTLTDPNHILGRETARMTAAGHTGIGIQWSNTLQPKRTLDVVRHDTVPQFRITQQNNASETGGVYTDFETSSLGHLHILPRDEETKNVGIGFLSDTSTPTERLDVYAGTARLRQMPDSVPNVLITGAIADTTDGDYILNYLEFSNNQNQFLAGNGTWQNGTNVCDWNISGQNLTMGWLGSPDACHTGNVGIGRETPLRKLDVLVGVPNLIGDDGVNISAARCVNNTDGTHNTGISGVAAQLVQSSGVILNRGGAFAATHANSTNGINIGVYTVANDFYEWNKSWKSYGLLSYASKSNYVWGSYAQATYGDSLNVGALGIADYPGEEAWNVGVYGVAYGYSDNPINIGTVGAATGGTGENYGIYGYAPGGTNSHAGYFTGNVEVTGTFNILSDQMFKTNVEEYTSGLDVINQLSPKTYNLMQEQFPNMGLSQELQYGLIAQELAEVVPELVSSIVSPTLLDTAGNEISSSIEYLGVNYIGLIPILISAVKEQQMQIVSQDESIAQLQESLNNQNEVLAQMMEQLANMQQQINQCCNANDGTKSMPGGAFQPHDLNNEKSSEGGNELYQNIPNPFRESTTISYQLETGGRVQLSIYDGNGKVVTTLVEANQPNGRHSAVWNANRMPAGVYHYALYVDGELLVKRAIKLQE